MTDGWMFRICISEIFIQRVPKGNKLFCSTDEFISLEDRQKEAFAEILLMTNR